MPKYRQELPEVATIERYATELITPDILSLRGIKNIFTSQTKQKLEGHYGTGRKIISRSPDGTIINELNSDTRRLIRKSPHKIVNDPFHDHRLNHWMGIATNILYRKSVGARKIGGDFVEAELVSPEWFDDNRFGGSVGIGSFFVLKKLASEMTRSGKGEYAIGVRLSHGEKAPTQIPIVGIGAGDKPYSGYVFNDRADVAFAVYGPLRAQGIDHDEARNAAVEQAMRLEIGLENVWAGMPEYPS